MKYFLIFILVLLFLSAGDVFAQTCNGGVCSNGVGPCTVDQDCVTSGGGTIPGGRPISLNEILQLSENLGGFLITLGGILAGLTIISSGLMYFFSGSSQQKVKTAKDILKAGLIGALIIFGSGLIINTIRGFTEDPFQFFQGGSGGGGGSLVCNSGLRAGQPCTSNNDCPNDLPGTCGLSGQPLCSYSFCL